MIQTGFESKVKVQQIINNQLPEFLLDENPKAVDFFKQYYISQEYQSGPVDIADNLDQYLKVDNLIPEVVIDTATTVGIITTGDTSITVSSTKGFPSQYGLLKIDDEIITYTSIATDNITFLGCKRGFSGITSYHSSANQEELVFSESSTAEHSSGSSIQNLSTLFLKEFYRKLKSTFTPGLENVTLVSDLDIGNFIKEANSFYKTKGTNESFRILFNVLYGIDPRIINLEDYLLKPSAAEYLRREVAIAEVISGDPSKLVGQTITKSTDPDTTASVSLIEAFTRDNVQYFKFELFIGYDESSTITGTFNITPCTKNLEPVSIGASVISVDSTVGFAKTGMVISGINSITYTSKSLDQFVGCVWTSPTGEMSDIASGTNIRSDEIYYGYENGDITKKVEIRLTGVLSDFIQVSDTLRVSEGDTIFVKNIGDLIENPSTKYPIKTYKEIFANSWIYNTSSSYDIESFGKSLTLTLKSDIDKSSLKQGDRIEIIAGIGTTNAGKVVYPTSGSIPRVDYFQDKSVSLTGFDPSFINPNLDYTLRRKINKANSSVVPIEFGNDTIISDIQNVYTTTDNEYAYVASNSLPSGSGEVGVTTFYTQQITKNINTASINDLSSLTDVNTLGNYTTITFSDNVPFRTGDKIYYDSSNPLTGLVSGTYYVEVLTDKRKIKLYNSAIFIATTSFITFTAPDIGFGTHNFTLFSQKAKEIGAQNIFKKFPLPTNNKNGSKELTLSGPTGMLINGVEINNYKSLDKVYYGPLESIDVLNGGSNYDVINLPSSTISTGIGTTALMRLVIGGEIKKVDIDALDFDIHSVNSAKVIGGNGHGAILEARIQNKAREVQFDGRTTTNSGGIDVSTNQLTFLTDHNFVNGQEVIYDSNNNTGIGVGIGTSSLVNNASYYIKVDNNTTVQLYPSYTDYSIGTNLVGFTTFYASGMHKFKTTNKRKTISEIVVLDGGSGYTNRKLIVKPAGISTVKNTVNFINHGFNDGDIINYTYETTPIEGLSVQDEYYILKLNDDKFQLANVGITEQNVGSVYFDGSSDHLNLDASSDFAFGTDDFTIECWMKTAVHSNDGGRNRRIWNTDGPTGHAVGNLQVMVTNSPAGVIWIFDDNSNLNTSGKGTTVVSDDLWHHIAVSRKSGVLKLFVDGSQDLSVTYTTNITANSGAPRVRLGSFDGTKGDFDGSISNLRVNKGTALYTEEFVPSRHPLKILSGTVLLACKDSKSASEYEVSPTAITNTGAGVSAVNPFTLVSGKDYYYKNQKPVNFTNNGSGYQNFAYPDIEVAIEYTSVGFGTDTQSYQTIIATPIVKGSILDTYVYEGGTGYGSSIINVEKKPIISIKTGREAQLKPILVNGTLNSVNIQFGGFEYYSIPELNVIDASGLGSGADLRPILVNGRISDVKVINAGIGYSSASTSIQVKPSGSGVIFNSNIRTLSVNNNKKLGNEYFVETVNNKLRYTIGGYLDTLKETLKDDGDSVSNIIGWAYDGNPIYGPYAYSDVEDTNSDPFRINSGYTENSLNVFDRPDGFDSGFFIEDYRYDNSGDLDEHNGRYAKTIDFPDGIYAYYATIDSSGDPQFPYFIGESYRSNTLEENKTLDQSVDFDNIDLLRNTFPYKVSDEYADNDFLIETNQITRQQAVIESISQGSITDFEIINSGSGYSIHDDLEFDNSKTGGGGGLTARVGSLGGKEIYDVQTSIETTQDAIFTWNRGNEVKVSILPKHDLIDNDRIVISGFSTNLTKLNNPYTIGITSYSCNLLSTCTASGAATTEIYVSYFPTEVAIGSSIGIGTETLHVLNVFENQNIIKVKRGLPGSSHTATSRIDFIPDSFTINTNIDYFESQLNEKVYFNARNSVGVGTTSGSGVQTSFTFGDSTITRVIPTKTLYLENHPFETNQVLTLTVPSSGELQISDTDTEAPWDLPASGVTTTVYVTNKTINTIGIRTTLDTDDVFFRDTQAQLTNNDEFLLESQFLQKKGNFEKITSIVSISTVGLATPVSGSTFHGLNVGDKINLVSQPNLTVGTGTSTAVRLTRGSNNENILTNPISIDAFDIDTANNQITLTDHALNTGDKISYGCSLPISGLSTGDYYIYKIDDDIISLCETYKNSKTNPPSVVSFASTGGETQTISPINPRIVSVKDNNLKFDLTDSSLSGYNLKIYYDQEFNNEFISVGTTNQFILTNVGTPGISTNASLTLDYDSNLPTRLYYNLEKSGYISTADTLVTNHSEILYVDSTYNLDYSIVGVGSTTFDLVLDKIPERLSYLQTECNSLKYSTTSKTAVGFIDKINITSGGRGYKDVPIFVGSTSTVATDALIVPKIIPTSTSIGNIKEVRIVNEGFEYSSDKTLQPCAQISPFITVKDSNTIGIVTIVDGGSGYTNAPTMAVVDTDTRVEITNGYLEAKLTGNAITSVDIHVPPKGLKEKKVELYTTNNTNGVSIQKISQTSDTEFICKITTPAVGFATDIFVDGEEVWIEGIQKVGTAGSGFNSVDYGFNFFTVKNYRNSAIDGTITQDEVVINVSEVTTNTGIAKTIQDSSGTIIRKDHYPSFAVVQEPSYFIVGEILISDGIERDLTVQGYDRGFIKVFGAYDLTIGEIITGKNSGNIATVEKIDKNSGRFKVNYSNRKNIGWADNIGKLDDDQQVIPDNDYYQNLSYSIKSPITWEDLQSPVNSMVHTVGLKNFADTGISSTATVGIGSSNATTVVRDVLEEIRVDTIYNFDDVLDIDTVGSQSKFLKLKNKKLTDYILSKTNVVLRIDNIETLFSDQGGDPFEYLNFYELDNVVSYDNILVRITDIFLDKIQLVDLVILGNGTDHFLLQKGNLANVGTGFTDHINDDYGTYSLETDEGANYLRFTPADPYSTDYDLKFINHSFGYASTGIGTTSVGFVDLIAYSGIVTADTGGGTGITSAIVGVATEKYSSLHLTTQVLDTVTSEMNFVELYISHNGDDTYLSEYYFDSDGLVPYSENSIGTFSANINAGNVYVNYTNDLSNDIQLKSKIVGFGETASNAGIGTFRYKVSGQTPGNERSAIYQSDYQSTVSAASTSVLSLEKQYFNCFKSLVEVSVGSTQRAVHQLLGVQDNDYNGYIEQESFLSAGSDSIDDYLSGIGTFGIEYSGSNFILQFYPDAAITSEVRITSLSECFYTENDTLNIPPNLEYGNITEDLTLKQYNAINGTRIDRLDFDLESDGIPIFAKTFNPSDSSVVNLSTGVFSIDSHWFRTGEALEYTPNSSFVGVGSTAMTYGIGHTLPSVVYAIREDDDNFKLATTRSNAMAGTNVSFGSSGEGNIHELAMSKSNEKVLITIDELVQYPLIYTPLVHTLSGNNGGQIGTASTIFALSGIGTINPEGILRIDDEYMKVVNVGFGSTGIGPITGVGASTLVQVDRAFVGSSATAHTDSTDARIYKGSYNIVNNKLHFTAPPRGNPQLPLVDISNLPSAKSGFTGRVFLRNDYSTNQIYDDLSDQFTGIGRTFDLTVGGANTTGIGTDGGNGIVFINSIFQTPTTDNNPINNYSLNDTGTVGVTSITFSGMTTSNGSAAGGEIFISAADINQNQIPRGGVIVSLGSSGGDGYAPLIGAQVIPTINATGGISGIVGVGTTVSPLTRSPLSISTASYDNTTGILTVTTTRDHGFALGIVNSVEMVGLHFTCGSSHVGVTTTIFPDATNDFPFDITGISSANTFSADVGISTIEHIYVGQGTVFSWYGDLSYGSGYNNEVSVSIGITDKAYDHTFVSAVTNAITGSSGPWTPTNAVYESHTGKLTLTIPSHGRSSGNIQIVQGSLEFTCSRDNHKTSHYYPRATDPAAGAVNLALTKIDDDTISVVVGAASSGKNASISAHPVGINTHIFRGATSNGIRRLSGTPGDLTATNAVYTPTTGIMTVTTATHSLSAETTKNVTDAVYTPATGIMTVTSASHGFSDGDYVKIVENSLTFTCDKDSNLTNHSYPRLTDPINNKWITIANKTTNTFELQVGTAVTDGNFTHTWAGGTASNAIKKANSWVGIATGSLSFTCAQDSHQSVHTYPRITDSAHWDSISVMGVESVPNTTTFTLNVGKSTNGSGGALTFNIDTAGTDYKNPEISVSAPSYEKLGVRGISRLSGGTDVGTGLLIDVAVSGTSTVGVGSEVFNISEYKIARNGYSFQRGDIIEPIGLVTHRNLISPISKFELSVDEVYSDTFGAWQFGEFDYIDSIKNYQDGSRVRFPLYYNDELLSFEAAEGSQVNLSNALLVVINGIIQDPGVAYRFEGGTSFTFTTAPRAVDNIAVFFYRGTKEEDDQLITDINQTLKRGDTVKVHKNNAISDTITQDKRTVFDLSYSDKFETNLYGGRGIDILNYKPLSWTKQKVDQYINGELVAKSRDSIESLIYPTSKVISDVATSDTDIFVEDTSIWDYPNASATDFGALIVPYSNSVSAAVTAIVAADGSIASLNIVSGGSGYVGATTDILISAPYGVGVGTVVRNKYEVAGVSTFAEATATITNGSITGTTLTNVGLGYSQTNPPNILIALPDPIYENVTSIDIIQGFSGIVTGITTTTIGVSTLGFKFFVNKSSSNWDDLVIDYPIYIFNTTLGYGGTSIDNTGSDAAVVGIGTTFLDNIYIVSGISTTGVNAEITVPMASNPAGIATVLGNTPIGQFSWGRLGGITRDSTSPISIGVTGLTVDSGLSTFAGTQRRGIGIRNTGALPKRVT